MESQVRLRRHCHRKYFRRRAFQPQSKRVKEKGRAEFLWALGSR